MQDNGFGGKRGPGGYEPNAMLGAAAMAGAMAAKKARAGGWASKRGGGGGGGGSARLACAGAVWV